MNVKELIEKLQEFPEDMEVMLDRNGSIYTPIAKPMKRYLNGGLGNGRDCVVLYSPISI